MGFFQNIKSKLFNKKEEEKELLEKNNINEIEESEEVSEEIKKTVTYDKGLEKTRKEFVSSLTLLGKKFGKVNDEYFDE